MHIHKESIIKTSCADEEWPCFSAKPFSVGSSGGRPLRWQGFVQNNLYFSEARSRNGTIPSPATIMLCTESSKSFTHRGQLYNRGSRRLISSAEHEIHANPQWRLPFSNSYHPRKACCPFEVPSWRSYSVHNTGLLLTACETTQNCEGSPIDLLEKFSLVNLWTTYYNKEQNAGVHIQHCC